MLEEETERTTALKAEIEELKSRHCAQQDTDMEKIRELTRYVMNTKSVISFSFEGLEMSEFSSACGSSDASLSKWACLTDFSFGINLIDAISYGT